MFLLPFYWSLELKIKSQCQTQELRSVLEDRVEIENTEYKSTSGIGDSLTSTESPGSVSLSASPQSAKGLSIPAHTRRNLCEIYVNNVDPLFKILHRPSLQAFLLEDKPYLDYEPDHLVPNSLALAVYYAAVCTIDDSQCQLLFGTDQAAILLDLQREVDAALVRMDIWTTNDLAALQAFVISLVSSRSMLPQWHLEIWEEELRLSSSHLVAGTKADVCGLC